MGAKTNIQHPEEHRHTLAEVQGWFAENGVEYLRAYPSAMLCQDFGGLVHYRCRPTGVLKAGWHRLDGLGLLGTRVAFSLPSVGALRSSRTAANGGGHRWLLRIERRNLRRRHALQPYLQP